MREIEEVFREHQHNELEIVRISRYIQRNPEKENDTCLFEDYSHKGFSWHEALIACIAKRHVYKWFLRLE